MLRRAERDESTEAIAARDLNETRRAQRVLVPVPELETDSSLLPRDHPQWAKDSITVSSRARELLARLKPVVVAIFTFWDHRIRSAVVGNARICVDPTGSYRIE